jgi:hypothetical protein
MSEIECTFVKEPIVEVILLLEHFLRHKYSKYGDFPASIRYTEGISTTKSTVNHSPSFLLTHIFNAQLPTTVIPTGFMNSNFQLVSSVGVGDGNGTEIPCFFNFAAACAGCTGVRDGRF